MHGILRGLPITFITFCYGSCLKSYSYWFYLHCSLPTLYWPVTNDWESQECREQVSLFTRNDQLYGMTSFSLSQIHCFFTQKLNITLTFSSKTWKDMTWLIYANALKWCGMVTLHYFVQLAFKCLLLNMKKKKYNKMLWREFLCSLEKKIPTLYLVNIHFIKYLKRTDKVLEFT